MTGYLRYLVAAIVASGSLVAAVPSTGVAPVKPGCVTINGVEFCSKVADAAVIGPDGCVSINGVRFCSDPQLSARAIAPGCVTINGVQFCNKEGGGVIITPDGCVSINGVKFCSEQ